MIAYEVNEGHLTTYDEGLLRWASAEYSLAISADDALAPGALKRAATIMDRHSEVGMVYGKVRIILDDDGPAEFRKCSTEAYTIWSGERFLKGCLTAGSNPVPTIAVVRTVIQRQLGGYRNEFPHGGDFEMWMRFAAHCSIAFVPTVQTYYRRHTSNMSRAYPPSVELPERVKILEHVATAVDSRFPEAASWLKVGFSRLGSEVYSAAGNAFDRGQMEELRALLDLANKISCGSYRHRAWWRLQSRRLLGQAVWQKVRPVLARLLGKSVIPRQPIFSPKRGEIFGSQLDDPR